MSPTSTTTSKFPTPLAGGGSNHKAATSHDSSRRKPKASDGITASSFPKRRLDSPRVILGPSSLPSRESPTARGYEDQRISEGERQATPSRHLRLLGSEGVKWPTGVSNLLLMLLLTTPTHAAGVCIVCPPGHTCPTGSAPVISGTPGQILRRTESGTEWVNIAAEILQNATGVTGTIAQIATALTQFSNEPFLFGISGRCAMLTPYTSVCRCYRYRLSHLMAPSGTFFLSEGAFARNANGQISWPSSSPAICPQDCNQLCQGTLPHWVHNDHFWMPPG